MHTPPPSSPLPYPSWRISPDFRLSLRELARHLSIYTNLLPAIPPPPNISPYLLTLFRPASPTTEIPSPSTTQLTANVVDEKKNSQWTLRVSRFQSMTKRIFSR